MEWAALVCSTRSKGAGFWSLHVSHSSAVGDLALEQLRTFVAFQPHSSWEVHAPRGTACLGWGGARTAPPLSVTPFSPPTLKHKAQTQ